MDNRGNEATYGYAIYAYMTDPSAKHLKYINGLPERMLYILYCQRIRIM